MTQPAAVTDRQTWEDLIGAIRETVLAIADTYDTITGRTDAEEQDVTDPDLEAELEDERQRRLDYETDGDLDGDYDPNPDEDDPYPDLEDE